MTNPSRPETGWLHRLPRNRLLAELSLWSADLTRLAADIARVETGTDIFHIDVADGHFAPAMLFFPDLVANIRRLTKTPLHVHLMVADAILSSQIDQFADAGADLISVHAENANAAEAIAHIRARDREAGIVLMLDTPVAAAAPYLGNLSALTLLGTRIGVKGQGLDTAAVPRLHEARALMSKLVPANRPLLCADGGIRDTTTPALRAASADTVVMGSLAFGAPDFAARIAWLHGLSG